MLLGPLLTTHTPPPGVRTVHLQDLPSCHEAHCGEEERQRQEEKMRNFLFSCFVFMSVVSKPDRFRCFFIVFFFFTWKGSVGLKA